MIKDLITWENFSLADRVGKNPRLYEIFQPGLKLKSKVNPQRYLSVASVFGKFTFYLVRQLSFQRELKFFIFYVIASSVFKVFSRKAGLKFFV